MTVQRPTALLLGLALGLSAQERLADPLEEMTASARSGDRSRLRERANLLRDRIRSNPAAARKFLLSDRDAARLRALDPTAPLEAFDTAVSSTVSVADDFEGQRATFIYEAGSVTGYQDAVAAPGAKCGDTVHLSGYRIADTLLVTDAVIVRRADTPPCSTLGPQKLAILYLRVPGLGAPLVTLDQLKTWVFSGDLSAPRFWDISSFGAVELTGDVIGPIDLDRQYGCTETTALQNAAYAAAGKLTDLTQYNRIFIAHASLGSCAWGGIDSLGCRSFSIPGGGTHMASIGEMNTAATLAGVQRYVFHEVGHGFGLLHSNAFIAPGETLPPDRSRASVLEYGDQYSTMGSGAASTYGLAQKEILGWLKEGESIRTVTEDTEEEILPMGLSGGGLRGLKVKRKTQRGDEYVWVEYRTQSGTDVNLPRLQPGAILHYSPTQVNLTGEILDATPGAPGDQQSYLDPILPVGRQWRDPYSGLSIEVVSAEPDKLRVSVRYFQPCANVTWPVSNVIPAAGGAFTARVAGSAGCQVLTRGNNYWLQPEAPGSATFRAEPNNSLLARTGTVTVDRQTVTVRQDPIRADLKIDSMAPVSGILRAGTYDQFQLNISAPNGPASIGEVRILLAASAKPDNACLAIYSAGAMRLLNNAGTADAGMIRSGTSGSTSNNQCFIATLGVSNPSSSVVRLSFYILPNSTSYLGDKKLFVALRHALDTAMGDYAEVGAFTVAGGCQAFLVPPRVSIGGAGGTATFSVNAAANCVWDAAASTEWARVTLNRTLNPPVATVAVSANTSLESRRAAVNVLGTAFVIDQLGAGLPVNPNVSFDGSELPISRRGGSGQAYFTSNLPRELITPVSDQPWLSVNYRASANNSIGPSVLYYAEANLSPSPRSATIRVGPALLIVVQEPGPDDPGRNAIRTMAGAGLAPDGPAMSVTVPGPGHIAYDRDGNLYIAEPDFYRVRKLARDGSLTTIAGVGAPGEPLYGGPATQSRLIAARGVAVNSKGAVYISMTTSVVRVEPEGSLTLAASDLGSVQGLSVDDRDNIYIADTAVNRIFVLRPDGRLDPFAGTGAAGFSGDGGGPLSARLRSPVSVAVAGDGSVYIADAGNFAIRKVSGGKIETVIGTGVTGNTIDGNPANGQPTAAVGHLTVDAAGLVYWVSAVTRIRYINTAGIVGTAAGGGSTLVRDGVVAASAFIIAQGVAFDPTSSDHPLISFADGRYNVVLQVDAGGKLVRLAGRDILADAGDGGEATSALLYWPLFGAYGPDGRLYFSDSRNHRIRRVNAGGSIETVAGTGVPSFGGDRGPAVRANLWEPSGLAFDAEGNLYFADTLNQRVRRVDKAGMITTVAGTGTAGATGDNGPATSATLRNPRGLAIDSTGTIYIADLGNHRIRAVNSTGQIGTIAGTGAATFSGDGGPADKATLNSPQAIALDSTGRLLIADSGNGRIRVVDESGTISTVAGNGLGGGSADLALSTALGSLAGLAVASNGDIYASDARSHQVVRITPDGLLQVVAGAGVAGFSGDGGPGWAALTFAPAGIVLSPSGDVVVFDSRNDRIRSIAAR